MAKKNYESPKMDEVKVNVEQDILAGSCSVAVGVGTDSTEIECGCPAHTRSDIG